MDYKNIHQILDKYWEGETSLEEEQTLRSYFNSDAVSDELKQFSPLFQYLNEEETSTLSEAFDQQLMEKLKMQPHRAKAINVRQWLSRAAAIALIIFAGFAIQHTLNNENDQQADIWEENETMTPEEAWIQTKAALELVSRKLNKGSKSAKKGMAKVKTVTKVIKQ